MALSNDQCVLSWLLDLSETSNITDRPSAKSGDESGSFKELFFVSLPLIISAGSHSVMSIADRVMLAGYTPPESSGAETLDVIAAVTPAAMMFWTTSCFAVGMVLYANTFISQFDGAGRPKELTASLCQAVWLALVTGLLLIVLIPFSKSIFLMAGHSDSVAAQESAYFNMLTGGGVLTFVSCALSCFFSGRRRTTVVMCVNVMSVVINIVLDYGFIFGNGGLPELGISGAATATVLARGCEVVMYVVLIRLAVRGKDFPFRSTWKPNSVLLKKYLRYGLPSGLHYFVENAAFLMFLFIVGSLSRNAMAATNLAFSVNSLIFVPLLGFGTAVQTLVGHHIGAKLPDAAVRTTWNAVRMGIVWTGAAALLLVCFPDITLKPFLLFEDGHSAQGDSIRSVIPTAASLLKFVAIYSVFDSMAVVLASALRGAGDTLFPMILTMCSSWLVMTIPAWLIVRSENPTIQMLWMTCTAHIVVMGGMMLWRFRSGKWRTIKLT